MFPVRTIAYADQRVVLDAEPRIVAGFDEVILMEGSGFQVRGGVAMYDGDLVRDSRWEGLFQVGYRQDFGWDYYEAGGGPDAGGFILDEDGPYIQVVGNVHENPELLPTPSPTGWGRKRRMVMDALPSILKPGEPLVASQIAERLDFDVSAAYVYALLKGNTDYRATQVLHKNHRATAFEPA